MEIMLGPLADALSVQFEKAGVRYIGKPSLDNIQKSANAISLLYIRGYLTEAETLRARKRLMKEIKIREVNSD